MRKTRTASICRLLSVSLWIGFCGTGYAQERVRLTMGSTSTASSHYTLAVAVAKATHDTYPEINITVAESGGAIENLQRIARGEIDLGISTSNASYEATHGLEQFEGIPNDDVRWLFTYGNVPILLLARKGTGIESIHDLNGKKFNPAQAGSSAAAIVERSLTLLGIEPEFYRGSYSDAVEAFQNKQIAGMSKTHGGGMSPDAVIMRVQASLPIHFLTFEPEDIDKIQAKYPHFRSFWLEPNIYKDQPAKILSVGMSASIVAQKSLPDDVAYKIVKAVIEGQEQIAESFKGLKNFDMAGVIPETATVPLHAGAVRYYLERGLEIPDSLIPPEYK